MIVDSASNRYFQEHEIEGKLKVNEDGTVTFLKEQNAIIDGIKINPESSDVNLCKIKTSCSGNYLFLAENELVAEGKGFSLRFLGYNKLFHVFEENKFFKELNQNDFLEIYLGNYKKNGKVEIKTEENLLPRIKTDGLVRIENDENITSIDDNKVKKQLFKTDNPSAKAERGSVHSAVIADNDNKKVYEFDESQNVHITSTQMFEAMNNERKTLSQRGVLLTGYFSPTELNIFKNELDAIENKFGIDFKKITIPSGEGEDLKLELFEIDKRKKVVSNSEARVYAYIPTTILWQPVLDLNDLKSDNRINFLKYKKEAVEYYENINGHEFGHVISYISAPYSLKERIEDDSKLESIPFEDSFMEKAEAFGIKFKKVFQNDHFFDYVPEVSPDTAALFPSEYSKTNIAEFTSELFRSIIHNPKWFTDPYNGGLEYPNRIIKLSKPVTPETMKQRQDLRDLWLKELEKYKKDK